MPDSEPITTDVNVSARMRDGAVLRADIYRPSQDGRFPAILARTPYGKSRGSGYMDPPRFARSGYVVVIQDCRGTGESEGEYYPWDCDTEDGYDTVEWLAAQPWCDGNVGMMGASNLGSTQWTTAAAQPPHLRAICPAITAPFLPFVNKGVMEFGACLEWSLMQSTSAVRKAQLPPQQKQAALEELARLKEHLVGYHHFLPLCEMPPTPLLRKLGLQPFFSDWASHMDDLAFWKKLGSPAPLDRVQVPVLHITDWYHPLASHVMTSYREMCERGGSELARQNQKLFLGPWRGIENLGAAPGTGEDITGLHLRWFDYWLKGIANGIMDEPRVTLFVMGENVWRDEHEWPLARTRYTPYYLHSDGHANTRYGSGVLTTTRPLDGRADHFTYDPKDPVPTKAQLILGPNAVPVQDQSGVEEREDVLVYSTPPLEEALEVTGPISITLWAASSAVDTDWTGKLVDVHPDGRAINLVDGILRARYRHSVAQPELLVPRRIYEFCIDLGGTSNLFKAGHRIRIEISSSNFPLHNRSLNTGHPMGEDKDIVVAHQRVYHDAAHPSHILLPVIRKTP